MRACGILFPISSLPSDYGIGSLGKTAYEFVDFLKRSKQTYWQILPIGPTGYGDSPYQSFSAYACNPYFIDLDTLKEQQLITQQEIDSYDFGDNKVSIDYYKLYINRNKILKTASQRFDKSNHDYQNFLAQNSYWLDDYAFFMSLKGERDMVAFTEWEEPILKREQHALESAKQRLADEIEFYKVVQYLFYDQWTKLKRYANERGIRIIGDIPIYVSPDSSDLWANSILFQVDQNGKMSEVAGVPPDAFTSDGQLWGNPLYNWEYHAFENYNWWIKRIRHALTVYDIVRIDHFRGFEGYYAIPAADINAKNGRWREGPGKKFIDEVKNAIQDPKIIAEDLGFLNEGVYDLLKHSGFPGMKVLQFAFDSREESDYLPYNYTRNSVVYTGTHDNTTTADWETSAPEHDALFCKRYLNIKQNDNFTRECIRSAMGSVSDTCIIPMADWLGLGRQARINTPSTLGGNWVWRAEQQDLTDKLADEIAEMTRMYGRVTY